MVCHIGRKMTLLFLALLKFRHLLLCIHTCAEGEDYVQESLSFAFLDDSSRNFTFNVTILEDAIVETRESFGVVLTVAGDISQHFFFETRESVVQILDNDGKRGCSELTLIWTPLYVI